MRRSADGLEEDPESAGGGAVSQSFTLVSTSRTRPTVRPTLGDVHLAYAGVVPIGYLALFDAEDVHALPWDRINRQLTLYTSKARALARLEQRAPEIAKRLARDFAVLAARQAKRGATGGVRPAGATLRAALAVLARRVEAAAGTHVQAFIDDSYYPWHAPATAQLVELVSAGEGADEGWSTFLAFSEVANATTRPWDDRGVENVLTGVPSDGPTRDSLAEWLGYGELLPGTLAAVFEALGRVVHEGRPPCLAELLGALARVIGDGVVLRVVTDQGTVSASMPAAAVDEQLPRASLPTLAGDAGLEFAMLAEVWEMVARGALADGPLVCSALEQDRGVLAVGPSGPPFPGEPFVLRTDAAISAAVAEFDAEDAAALAAVLAHADPRAGDARSEEAGDVIAEATWARLLADPSPAVRAAVVGCSSCPLAMPASERHPGVRASSRAAHPWELTMLAGHADLAVRAAVARNVETPRRVLLGLARDPAAEVRRAAAWPVCQAAFDGDGDDAARRVVEALARDGDVSVRREIGESVRFLAPEDASIGALLAVDRDPGVAAVGRMLGGG